MTSTHHSTRHFPRGFHPRRAILALALAALVLLVILVSHPGPLHAQTVATAPGNLQATVVAGGVQLSWSAPTENAGPVTGYRVLRRASGQSGMMAHVPDTGSSGTGYTDRGAAKRGETYIYQVRALSGGLTGEASDSAAVTIPGTCPISGGSPVDVPVAAVPIVVTSTVEDYFVLYVRHEKGGETIEYPVLVKRGEAGTTTLEDNLAPLPAGRYKVKKYPVNNPADVDGDCIDDLTELADAGTKNPVNPAASVHISNGAVSIADRAAFQRLSYQGERPIPVDRHLVNLEYIKFIIMNPGSDRPAVYFMNTVSHRAHHEFADALGFYTTVDPWRNSMHGELVWHPDVAAPDGSRGVYRFVFRPWDDYSFDAVAFSYEALAASMPLLENNLAYYPVYHPALPRYHREKALYDASRVNVLLEGGIAPEVDFIPLNEGEGYGLLREMELEERPSPRDIVIYETLPNDLPRVAGIITGVPQTPLSHVNLRAVQNGLPNAFIRAPLDDAAIDDLLDRHVYYKVTQSGYTLRAATRAEVDAHYDASRPASAQTPERDLSVTKITPLSEIGFEDWDAFGVKAANMAVLGTLGFPEGTVRDGFAVPFYFYDEFMKNAGLAEETVFGKGKGAAEDRFTLPAGTKLNAVVTAILAHPRFRTDYEIQDEMLDDLREAIRDARSPAWIITALETMHARFPEGTSLRYRSSTNNEDLPGYNGAGLYSSKTQDPGETAEEGIDKSIKGVWASLWNFRAFVERDFHRIDHAGTAMGVLVHPNYSLEKANGVAVSFDPVTNRAGAYYVNTQLGEDLITNPEAHSRPEEILLLPGGRHEVLVRSNLAEPGKLLMSAAQLKQLRSHLEVIHKKFSELYGAAEGEPFAMDIEFKITSLGNLSIKQARPWVFQPHLNRPPTVSAVLADVTIVNESGTREISLNGVFADDDGDALTVTATSSDESVATVSVSADHATLTAQARARGTATITVAAADGNGGSVEDSFTVQVKAAPVVASAIEDVTGLEVGSTQAISLSGVFSDADGDALTITAASSDRGVAAVSVAADYSGLTVSGVAEGAATITLAAQDSGTPKPTVNQPGAYGGYTLFYHDEDVKFYLIDSQGRKAFEWPGYVGLHGKLLDNGNLLSGHGSIGLAERNHRTIAVWFETSFSSHHDVLKLPNGNYLILHEVSYGKEAALAAGANPECLKKNGAIKVDEVVELTPRGEVAWRWRTWDHLIQDHDPDQANYGTVADHPGKIDINYGLCRIDGTRMSQGRMTSLTHLNSLDYNADLNQIMVTVRHFSEFWIIDRSTTTAEAAGGSGGKGGKGGDLLYRWGNPRAYRQGTKDDQKLFFPHNAHWIPAGLPNAGQVLVYNNGNEHSGFGRAYSSVDEVTLPADGYAYTRAEGSAYGPSGPTWSYRHSDGYLAAWGSNAQRLPNGNTLVVDAPIGRIREVTRSQDVVWEYRRPGDRWTYRAYRYAPDHPGVKALPLTPEGGRKPAANLVSDTFLVSVVSLNNPPTVASAIGDATIVNESGTREISLSDVFADDDGDALTVTATSSDENVATVSVSADHATLTAQAQARGAATITVVAADGNGGSVEDSFTVRVKAAPVVASAIEDVTGLEVGSTQDISLSGVFSDADGDALTVTAASSDENVVTVSVSADRSKLTVSGAAEGTATITVTAQGSDTPTATVNQPGAYEGYTLFYHPKDVQFYLIDNQGRKAFGWSQPFGNHGKLLASGNLLTGNGPVHLTERNPRGIPVWSYGRMPNHHDVLKLSNGNYLFLHEVIYQKVEAVAEGANPECLEKNATVKIDEVVEITPNGEVVWRWRVWDHLIQDHDPDQANYGTVADHPEKIDINYGLCRFDGTDRGPTHLNALDYNAALNQIMITSRHFSEIWIIDRSTTMAEAAGSSGGNGGRGGDLLYRWGNPRAYRQGTKDDQKLFFPHNAHWIPAGLPGAGRVLLYNNGNEHPGFVRGYSSVDEITLPADGYAYTRAEGSVYGPSGPTWSYRHSDGSLAYWGSGAQRLPNGNTLVVDAPLGRIREVTQSQDVVWEYRSPENRGMYRAYKYAPDHPGVRALSLTPEGDREPVGARHPTGNRVSDAFLVSVVSPNNPPTVASAIADVTIVSESGTHEASLTGVFGDADVAITATSSDESVAKVSVSADYSNLTVAAKARGTTTVTVSSGDGHGGSVEDSFAVMVKAAPTVASAIADVSGLIVGDRRDISLNGVFSDPDGDALTVTAASSDDGKVTVTVAADQSKLTVAGVAEGTATITVTARDVDGNSVSDAFEVSVARAEPPEGPEPWNIRVVPGDGTLTVTWRTGSRAGVAESEIRHAVRWSQKPGVWNNPRDPRAVGRNDGVHVAPGETEYVITGLENGVPAGVFVRSFTGHRNNMSERDPTSSQWVRVKGVHTTPVAPPNNAPTVSSGLSDATIVNERGMQTVSLTGVFADADGDALTITARSSDENVATVSVSADRSTLTVSAKAGGRATITITAEDGRGGEVSDEFSVRVKGAPAVASPLADVSELDVEATHEVSLSGVFSDPDGDGLTVTAASSDDGKATVAVASDYSKLTVTGVAEGTATITVTARDVDGNSVSDAFDVTVAVVEKQVLAAGRWPLAFGDAAAPDAVYTAGAPAVRAAGPDAAGEPEPPRLPEASGGVGEVTYSAVGLPAGLSLDPDRVIRGAPEAATASPARVTYSATDEAGESVSLTFQVTVNPAVTFADTELSPFTNDIIEYTVGQDADLRFVFPEASGGTGSLTYRLDNREPDVAINDYARGLTFDPITRTLSSGAGEDQPVAGQRYALTYRAEDERGSRAAAYGSIEVNEAPSLPETADRSFTAGSAVSVTLPAATGGSAKITRLRYSLEPQIPGLSFNSGARELSGTPTATGATVMTFTVMDRNGVTDTTTFTITVAAGAGAPASAPGSVRAAQAPGLKTFGMSWAEVAGASEYVVQVAAEGSGFPTDSAVNSGPAGARVSVHQCCSRAVVDVAEYGNYRARVAAVNAEGAGPWSAATLVAVAEPPPPEPEPVKTYALTPAVRVVEGDYYSLKLTLSDPVPAPYATFRVSIGYGSANAEDVYSGAISTFTLGAGAASWHFSVPTRDDAVDEDDETFTVVVSPTYIKGKWEKAGDGRDTATVTIADDDTAGITVIAANPLAAAEGGTATYTVVLDSQPTADVTVTPGSSDGGAVTVAPASHTFTPSDWNRAATFTVSAVADDDGDDEDAVISHRVGSQDTKYAAVPVSSVSVAVSDTTPPDQQQKVANNPPAVASAIDDATIVNETGAHRVSLSSVFSDADGDSLTITAASSDESVATVSVASDQSRLTVTAKARGTAMITVTASDGNGGTVSDSFTVTVKAAPVVAAAIDDVSEVFIDATHEVDLTEAPSDADEEVLTDVFTDADGDALTITAESSDTEVLGVATVVDESTRTVTGLTVTGVAEGTATVTVTAEDADGNRVSDEFDVTVTEDTGSQFYDGGAAPGPVADLQLTAEGVSLIVSWSAPAPESGGEVTGYIVHLKPDGGGKGRTKTPRAKKTKVSFDNLEAGQTYKVWVRAENEAGKGERVHASITLPEE